LDFRLFTGSIKSVRQLARGTARHTLLDCPVERVEGKDAQLGINVAIRASLNKELNQLRNVLT
jgi:hypothetical protein